MKSHSLLFWTINILKVSNKILPYLYNCSSTIQRLFTQAFFVSKLKLENTAGYNLFALSKIQLIFYSARAFSLTYIVHWTVCSGKKIKVIRSLEWHSSKQMFNPNKSQKQNSLVQATRLFAHKQVLLLRFKIPVCCTVIFYHEKHRIVKSWAKPFIIGRKTFPWLSSFTVTDMR